MNILEQMAHMANKGELAEPLRAVEYVKNIAILTENYTNTGVDKGNDGFNPPVVDAATIREEMAKDYRQTTNYQAEIGIEMPYFTNEENGIETEGE